MTIRDLRVEIGAWLDSHGPETATQVAYGIRARYSDVLSVLKDGPFPLAPTPPGGSPAATYWAKARDDSQAFPSTPSGTGGRSQCARILGVLADGKEHEMREIHARAGFSRLNSRVSELRSRGFVIACRAAGGRYFYKLVTGPGALPDLPQVSAPEHIVEPAAFNPPPVSPARLAGGGRPCSRGRVHRGFDDHIAEGEPSTDPIGVGRDGEEASPSAFEYERAVKAHAPGAAEDLGDGPAAPTPLFEIPAPRGPGAYGNEAA